MKMFHAYNNTLKIAVQIGFGIIDFFIIPHLIIIPFTMD